MHLHFDIPVYRLCVWKTLYKGCMGTSLRFSCRNVLMAGVCKTIKGSVGMQELMYAEEDILVVLRLLCLLSITQVR
jgi:hypothetical protein